MRISRGRERGRFFLSRGGADAVGSIPNGACLSIPRGRERGRFFLSRGGADAVGSRPNKEATTTNEGKSARSRRVGKALCSCATVGFNGASRSVSWGVCGVARLVRGTHHGLRRAPCIRAQVRMHPRRVGRAVLSTSLSLPTRLTGNTQTGSQEATTTNEEKSARSRRVGRAL